MHCWNRLTRVSNGTINGTRLSTSISVWSLRRCCSDVGRGAAAAMVPSRASDHHESTCSISAGLSAADEKSAMAIHMSSAMSGRRVCRSYRRVSSAVTDARSVPTDMCVPATALLSRIAISPRSSRQTSTLIASVRSTNDRPPELARCCCWWNSWSLKARRRWLRQSTSRPSTDQKVRPPSLVSLSKASVRTESCCTVAQSGCVRTTRHSRLTHCVQSEKTRKLSTSNDSDVQRVHSVVSREEHATMPAAASDGATAPASVSSVRRSARWPGSSSMRSCATSAGSTGASGCDVCMCASSSLSSSSSALSSSRSSATVRSFERPITVSALVGRRGSSTATSAA
eukprot:Unigene7097_Nuclearia_a/m.21745 Unigene7097_Nuclearia_a/g.21745  ORF Unigene7097_Nuclearia_a/g.21745 Unigene7097_Nuclearia_a/m.21745 type:complete len:342 (+) Unigene7097_Nuclearia_a:2011-3036(+)